MPFSKKHAIIKKFCIHVHNIKLSKISAHNHIDFHIKNRGVLCIYRVDLSHRGLLGASAEIYKVAQNLLFHVERSDEDGVARGFSNITY